MICLVTPVTILSGFYRTTSYLISVNESLELPESFTETPESNNIEHHDSG